MPYDLSIIIVNWNGGALLTRCVETIVTSAPKTTYEIVVVDNDSHDDSVDQLRASEVAAPLIATSRLRIVVNSENRGFGAANNQGWAFKFSRNTPKIGVQRRPCGFLPQEGPTVLC